MVAAVECAIRAFGGMLGREGRHGRPAMTRGKSYQFGRRPSLVCCGVFRTPMIRADDRRLVQSPAGVVVKAVAALGNLLRLDASRRIRPDAPAPPPLLLLVVALASLAECCGRRRNMCYWIWNVGFDCHFSRSPRRCLLGHEVGRPFFAIGQERDYGEYPGGGVCWLVGASGAVHGGVLPVAE